MENLVVNIQNLDTFINENNYEKALHTFLEIADGLYGNNLHGFINFYKNKLLPSKSTYAISSKHNRDDTKFILSRL